MAYLAAAKTSMAITSASLNQNLLLASDAYAPQAGILSATYGFEGYMGVPGLNGTDSASQAAAQQANVAWELLDPSLGGGARAFYSAIGYANFLRVYGVAATQLDTLPVVFSHPVLASSAGATDFRVTLNTGAVVTPVVASFLPNLEYNERQTVVMVGEFGNRLTPGTAGAVYPVSVSVVDDGTPLTLVTPAGFVSAVGMGAESQNPYVQGQGPRMVAAKLDAFSSLGEGAPLWQPSSVANSGSDLYGAQALYRLRVYTSAGFSPDGIASILPTEYSRYFRIDALDAAGHTVSIERDNTDYVVAGHGTVRVLGLADVGPAQAAYLPTYVGDHDNQIDIILSGDLAAIMRLQTVHLPSAGGYSAVYNPGGPGNDPSQRAPGPFTVASTGHSVAIDQDFSPASFVSFVEVDGAVVRNAQGQPVGAHRGLAVTDSATGHQIHQYLDPNNKVFYASFEVSPVFDMALSGASGVTPSRVTDDHIQGTQGIDSVSYAGRLAQYLVDGDLGRVHVHDTVARRDGSDMLAHVDRLLFSDLGLALDINGHAGTAAKVMAAVFGPEALQNPVLAGVALRLLDGGMGEDALVRLALQARLGADPGHRAVVDLLYTHLAGHAPTDAEAAPFVAWLDGSMSPEALGVMAAHSTLNTAHIDLVGLASQGLVYVPLGM